MCRWQTQEEEEGLYRHLWKINKINRAAGGVISSQHNEKSHNLELGEKHAKRLFFLLLITCMIYLFFFFFKKDQNEIRLSA